VATEAGSKRIDEVRVGDRVWAYDQSTATTGSYTVTAVWAEAHASALWLTLAGERIATTDEHPFYTRERGWVAAGDLRVGETVRRADGSFGAVQEPAVDERPAVMYNLTVAGAHTFFVGEQQALVHNDCPPGTKPGPAAKDIPWSSSRVRNAAIAIERGSPTTVHVASRAEAEELVRGYLNPKGYLNTSGLPPSWVRGHHPTGKDGTYHWDDRLDESGRVEGHGPDNPHGGRPHLQVQTPNGDIIRIFW
jgi:hypothetical protein